VGASVYSPDLPLEIRCKLPPDVSTFSAEAWAIYEALFIIHQLQIPSAIIFSDCKSVLQTITSYNIVHNNYVITLIRNMYSRAVNSSSRITVAWIPSHKGIVGNERADALAKEAITIGRKTNFKVPYTDLFHRSKYILDNKRKDYLKNAAYTTGNFYHTHYHTDNVKPWYYQLILSRAQIVIVNRLCSGHYNLNYSLHRKNIVTSAGCPCGDSYQDANHVIFRCELTRAKSPPLFKYLREKFPTSPINIFPLIKNPTPKLCRLLLAFFNSCKLYI
ncbi:Ribonuclease H1, partial [Temnothorax longispinosus]